MDDIDVEKLDAVLDIEQRAQELSEQFEKEQERLLAKYNMLKAPILEKRDAMLADLPGFWSTAFLNYPMLHSIISDNEFEVFNYLKNFVVKRIPAKGNEAARSFKIILDFDENPFFSDKQFVKSVYPNTASGEDQDIAELICDPVKVHFKPGKEAKFIKAEKEGAKKRKRNEEHVHGENCHHDHDEDDDEEPSFFAFLMQGDDLAARIAENLANDFYPNAAQFFAQDDDEEEDDEDSMEDDE